MTLETLAIYGAALSLLIGSAFVLVGVIGLLKFNDPMTRLHAPTKVGTVGIGMLLLASMLNAAASGDASALAEAVANLTGNLSLARAMGDAGKRRVIDHYSWTAITQRLDTLYASLDVGKKQ